MAALFARLRIVRDFVAAVTQAWQFCRDIVVHIAALVIRRQMKLSRLFHAGERRAVLDGKPVDGNVTNAERSGSRHTVLEIRKHLPRQTVHEVKAHAKACLLRHAHGILRLPCRMNAPDSREQRIGERLHAEA